MYERILLAYDGTREGLIALREGALLAKRCDAKVFLFSVLPETGASKMAESVGGDVVGQQMDTYRELMGRGVQALERLGFHPSSRLVIGEPAPEICAFAEEIDADLVVVGHRRRGALERWWSSSAGAYLNDHLECSLLIGRKPISDEAFAAASQAAAGPS